jgi:hypothetical protein
MTQPPGVSDSTASTEYVYALVPTVPMPSFDSSKTFRRRLLPSQIDKKYRTFTRRYHGVISVCYFVGLAFRIVGFVCPLNRVTYWLIVVSPFLQTQGLLSVSLALSSDMVRLLFGQFDSWFLLISLIVWTIFLGISYDDIRVLLLPYLILDLMNASLSDAYIHPSQLFTASALFAIVFISILYVQITLDFQGLASVVIAQLSKGFAITSIDIVQSTTLTVGMLVLRVAFNKLRVARSRRNAVQTIVYRCKVKFEVLASATLTAADGRVTSSMVSSSTSARKTVHQLKLVPFGEHFDAMNTVVPRMSRSLDRLSPTKLGALYFTGGIGFLATITAMQTSSPEVKDSVGIVALGATILFTSVFATLYQRQLLRRLCRSFDCLFVLFQIVTAFVCIVYLAYWDQGQVVGVCSNLVWLLWVLGMDALTPAARHKLGLRPWFAVPVLVWNISMSTVGVVHLSVNRDEDLQDRIMFEGSVLGHDVHIYTTSFLLGRLLLVVVWCVRLTWRLCTRRHGDECILLNGSVEYTGRPRGWSLAPKFGAVAPNTQPFRPR